MAVKVDSKEMKTGLFNRIFHQDVNSTFRCVQKVANSTSDAIAEVQDSIASLQTNQNTTTEHVARLQKNVTCLEKENKKTLSAHTVTLNSLNSNYRQIKRDLEEVQRTRDTDRESMEETIHVIHDLSRKVVPLEALSQRVSDEHKAVKATLQNLELSLQRMEKEKSDQLTLGFEETQLHYKETLVKVHDLVQTNEHLTIRLARLEHEQQKQESESKTLRSQMHEMAQVIQGLATNVATLSAWKEQSLKQQERHENILLYCYQLQSRLTETIATMSQDQQFLFHLNQGMDSKLGLLLEKSGIDSPKTEIPVQDRTAPFRDILTNLKEMRQLFEKQ